VQKLKAAGYNVRYIEFNGPHAIQPAIVSMAIQFFLD
jgi:phospholipase/carboxylesterase